MSFHQTIIVGHLGGDPRLTYLENGTAVCNFDVAVNENWTDRNGERHEKTIWYQVAAWNRLAETCNQYLERGRQVMVTGTVEARAYTGNDDEPAASLNLRARDVQFLGQGKSERKGRPWSSEGRQTDSSVEVAEMEIPF